MVVEDRPNPVQRLARRLGGIAALARLFSHVMPVLDGAVGRLTRRRRTLTAALLGLPVVLLETTGARSGLTRTHPLLGLPVDGDIVVLASHFGRASNPAWYLNLRAHPRAAVLVRGRRVEVEAREVEGDERTRLWAHALTLYPAWADYQRRAGARVIPVVRLVPV